MSENPQEYGWEECLKRGFGEAPPPDFDAWRQGHAAAVHYLNPIVTAHARRRRRILMNSFKLAAASLLVAMTFVWFRPGGALDAAAFAEAIPGVDEVQTVTWTRTFYERVTSADGKRTWLKPVRQLHAYRHPGRYRETIVDAEGAPRAVRITDVRAGRELWLDLEKKEAVLKTPSVLPDMRGPFAWVGDALRDRLVANQRRVKSVELLGQKPIDNRKANVFRALIDQGADQGYRSHDVWIDAETKQLVAIQIPGSDIFDPETAPDRRNTPEKTWSKAIVPGWIDHEIVLDAKLDPALFRLDPPQGFRFEAVARPTVTEEEMIEFLEAVVRFNGGMFPDSPYGLAVDRQAFNAASEKPAADRTEAERKLIELYDRYLRRELNQLPVRRFEEDHTVPKSFQYIGTGVKLGQSERIVCWYKLKNAAKHRAVYGDLTIKDITAAELPLNVD